MIPLPLMLFLKSYWKHIVLVIALVVIYLWVESLIVDYGNKRYNEGKAAADAVWITEHNRVVDEHNVEVANLKLDSKANADSIEERAKIREKALQKIIDDLGKDRKPNAPKTSWVPTENTVCFQKDSGPAPAAKVGDVQQGSVKAEGLAMDQTMTSQPLKLYAEDTGLLNIPLGESFVKTWNLISELE